MYPWHKKHCLWCLASVLGEYMIAFRKAQAAWLHKLKKHTSHWERLQRFSRLPRYWQASRSCFMSKSLTVFKGFCWNIFAFENDKFPCDAVWWSKMSPQWWTPEGDHLYWNPYYNGLRELQRYFSTFFGSVGPQRRSHTLPALPRVNKYICNIKLKIIIFPTCFSCGFGIDFYRKPDDFYSKTCPFWLVCWER